MSPDEVEWMHWVCGILTACLILPVWANWVSGGKIRLGEKGMYVPFVIGLLGGVGAIIGFAIGGEEWGASGYGLSIAMGIALLALIVKGVRGDRLTKEDEEDY